jgi:hypothetical protein
MMGLGLIMWGLIAAVMAPSDLYTFSNNLHFGTTAFWIANYIVVGILYITAAIRNHPPMLSLLVGGYSTLIWTWIASMRGTANFTSGVTLNIIVIVMGLLLVQRSSIHKK